MSENYQTGQYQLHQMRMQQQQSELASAQQKMQRQMVENANRFTQMREQQQAAMPPILPFSRGLVPQQLGGFTQSRRGLLGDILGTAANDALGFNLFGRAGFSTAYTTQEMSSIQHQRLGLRGATMGTRVLAAVAPEPLQRLMGFQGGAQREEGALAMQDAFASVRGNRNRSQIGGRGISASYALELYDDTARAIKGTATGRRMTGAEIGRLASSVGDLQFTQQQNAGAGNRGAAGSNNEAIVKALLEISKNTKQSVDQATEQAKRAKAQGIDVQQLQGFSRTLAANNVNFGMNDRATVDMMMGLGVSSRQAGLGFDTGQQRFGRVSELVRRANSPNGLISRDNLYRYGGSSDTEAASLIEQREFQIGQQYASRNISSLGVLSGAAGTFRDRGLVGTYSEIAAASINNPFAGLNARFDRDKRRELTLTAPATAYAQASRMAELNPYSANPTTKRSLITAHLGPALGVDELEAMDIVERLEQTQKSASASATELLSTQARREGTGYRTVVAAGVSQEQLTNRIMGLGEALHSFGANMSDLSAGDISRLTKKGTGLANETVLRAAVLRTRHNNGNSGAEHIRNKIGSALKTFRKSSSKEAMAAYKKLLEDEGYSEAEQQELLGEFENIAQAAITRDSEADKKDPNYKPTRAIVDINQVGATLGLSSNGPIFNRSTINRRTTTAKETEAFVKEMAAISQLQGSSVSTEEIDQLINGIKSGNQSASALTNKFSLAERQLLGTLSLPAADRAAIINEQVLAKAERGHHTGKPLFVEIVKGDS